MKTSEIREKFVSFFRSKDHTFVPPASTLAIGDPTLYFTIAGMTQFKAALTGQEVRAYKRAANFQKCIRVADLDDIGKDGRHLTMFEMLGSWSFGDYYKAHAIEWAFEWVRDVLKLDMSKLWVSVHHSDTEAWDLWQKVGQPAERIVKLGDKDNFWAMGPTGPCGPCSELYFDRGPQRGRCQESGFTCTAGPGCDCDRYLEFWNLVFMQFDRQEDGTLKELPFKSVDTGAGLERIACLVQDKESNFEIDAFEPLIGAVQKAAAWPSPRPLHTLNPQERESIQVVADHARMLAFTLADGATFSAEGRGYVLRRVLRRAVRHARRLVPSWPKDQSFLAEVIPAVIEHWSPCYPELAQNKQRILQSVQDEEVRFVHTLDTGLDKLKHFIQSAKKEGRTKVTGQEMFLLHDSYGFPADLTRILCEESGMQADEQGFAEAMKIQRKSSQAESTFYKHHQDDTPWETPHEVISASGAGALPGSLFVGYGIHKGNSSIQGTPTFRFNMGNLVAIRRLKTKHWEGVFKETPFYPEGGGQVADTGWLLAQDSRSGLAVSFRVTAVTRLPSQAIAHVLEIQSGSWAAPTPLAPDSPAFLAALKQADWTAQLDLEARLAAARNHSATHLLHAALRTILGDDVRQAGSHVSAESLRFDFTHPRALSDQEVSQVESWVNARILEAHPLNCLDDIPIEKAKAMGALHMFDEKYSDRVRVVDVPQVSMELCGGTHVENTSRLGGFHVVSESSVTAGVRRIEAKTGWGMIAELQRTSSLVEELAKELGTSQASLLSRVQALKDQVRKQDERMAQLLSKRAGERAQSLLSSAKVTQNGIRFVAQEVEAQTAQEVEFLIDELKASPHLDIVVLGTTLEGKVFIMCALATHKAHDPGSLNAGQLVKVLCEKCGGKGGGKVAFARGGASVGQGSLKEAFKSIPLFLEGLS